MYHSSWHYRLVGSLTVRELNGRCKCAKNVSAQRRCLPRAHTTTPFLTRCNLQRAAAYLFPLMTISPSPLHDFLSGHRACKETKERLLDALGKFHCKNIAYRGQTAWNLWQSFLQFCNISVQRNQVKAKAYNCSSTAKVPRLLLQAIDPSEPNKTSGVVQSRTELNSVPYKRYFIPQVSLALSSLCCFGLSSLVTIVRYHRRGRNPTLYPNGSCRPDSPRRGRETNHRNINESCKTHIVCLGV